MTFREKLNSKRRGGASIFIVAFTIIILSIIVLGFTRLIISEATKTSNTDLSQSAYDSALAGIEDAKIALLRYHECLDQGHKGIENGGHECNRIIYYMEKGIKEQDCSTVRNVLGRSQEDDNHAVVVQETQTSNEAGNNSDMLQAYTCATIQEDLKDYRTTLNSLNRLRIIPIRSSDKVNRIKLSWFSSVNLANVGKNGGKRRSCPSFLYALNKCNDGGEGLQAPTTLSLKLIQTDTKFDLSELSAATTLAGGGQGTDIGVLHFVPDVNNGNDTKITADKWYDAGNKGENNPERVNCKSGGADWLCTVDIDLPKTFKGNDGNSATTFLIVSIPYGMPETDISLSSFDGATQYTFTGVQARIDSTGRANDLYRRVETRIELVDTYYPYPEFEITMTGNENTTLEKSFYSTINCWGLDSGALLECENTHRDLDLSNL